MIRYGVGQLLSVSRLLEAYKWLSDRADLGEGLIMAGYKFFWQCPNCGSQLELKMRETLRQRYCPRCRFPITPDEIDRQEAEWQRQEAELRRREAERRSRVLRTILLAFGGVWLLSAGIGGLFLIAMICLGITGQSRYHPSRPHQPEALAGKIQRKTKLPTKSGRKTRHERQ